MSKREDSRPLHRAAPMPDGAVSFLDLKSTTCLCPHPVGRLLEEGTIRPRKVTYMADVQSTGEPFALPPVGLQASLEGFFQGDGRGYNSGHYF